MSKISFKQKLANQLQARIGVLEKKMGRFHELNAELRDCRDALKSLGTVKTAPAADTTSLHFNGDNTGPLSASGKALLNRMTDHFGTEDLFPLLENDRGNAYQHVAAWKRANWIETQSRGQYRKLVVHHEVG